MMGTEKMKPLITTPALALCIATGAVAQEKTEFRVAWSIYVGWMPWGYLEDSGIMDKWADKYGIDVEIVQINDYIESINQYTVDPLGRWRGHHGADRGRLFQRQ